MSGILAGVVGGLVGVVMVLVCDRRVRRERDRWQRAASALWSVTRGLDAWPVAAETPREGLDQGRGMAYVPVPVAVAVIGRHDALDRWAGNAARALAQYDLAREASR